MFTSHQVTLLRLICFFFQKSLKLRENAISAVKARGLRKGNSSVNGSLSVTDIFSNESHNNSINNGKKRRSPNIIKKTDTEGHLDTGKRRKTKENQEDPQSLIKVSDNEEQCAILPDSNTSQKTNNLKGTIQTEVPDKAKRELRKKKIVGKCSV